MPSQRALGMGDHRHVLGRDPQPAALDGLLEISNGREIVVHFWLGLAPFHHSAEVGRAYSCAEYILIVGGDVTLKTWDCLGRRGGAATRFNLSHIDVLWRGCSIRRLSEFE